MLDISKEKLSIKKDIYQKKEIIFVEGDMIIPDSKPDILKSICVSGISTIYKKETMEGKIRIDGNVNTYIMYLADNEQGETRGINTSLDFSEVIDIEGATEQSSVNLQSKVKMVECTIINERKISLKATLEINIKITQKEEIEVINDIMNAKNLQIQKENISINTLIGEQSTKIYGKDNISIDQVDELAEILKVSLNVINKEIKMSYNKVLTKADTQMKIMYLTEDNNIKIASKDIPIVGFIDLQDVTENSSCEAEYELRNILIKPNSAEEHSIYVELEMIVSCSASEKKQITIVKDLYSPNLNMNCASKQINLKVQSKSIREQNQVNTNVSIENMETRKLLDVEIAPIIINQSINNIDIRFECELEMNFILLNKNTSKIETKIEKVPFEFSTKLIQEETNVKAQIEIGKQDFIIKDDESISCNVDVWFNIDMSKSIRFNLIDNIEEKGEREEQSYSVIIYIVKKEDTLWKIGKRYGSTVEDIMKINNISDSNPITAGQKIFIPRFCNKEINSKVIQNV